jgi:hypothetical protein
MAHGLTDHGYSFPWPAFLSLRQASTVSGHRLRFRRRDAGCSGATPAVGLRQVFISNGIDEGALRILITQNRPTS